MDTDAQKKLDVLPWLLRLPTATPRLRLALPRLLLRRTFLSTWTWLLFDATSLL